MSQLARSSAGLARDRLGRTHWATIRAADEVMLPAEKQATHVPTGSSRFTNPGNMPLYLIEAQSGGYLGEYDVEGRSTITNRSLSYSC